MKERKKWNKEAIMSLIEAYKEETCLYAVNTPNYHNRNDRNRALKNVCAAVSVFQPGVTENECATKFYNMRTQFNIENIKVKASMKSETGTDNMYKPNLWYFDHLKYLGTYFASRKSRNSIEKNFAGNLSTSTQDEELSETQQQHLNECSQRNEIIEEEWLDACLMENSTDEATNESVFIKPSEIVIESGTNQLLPTNSFSAIKCVTPDRTSFSANISRPPPSTSPANCSTSSSGISSSAHLFSSAQKPRKKHKSSTPDAYAGAIEALADSIKQPIIIKSTDASTNNFSNNMSDPIDTCMVFVGSVLKRFKNEILKLEVINTLVQTVLNASTQDLENARQDN